MDSQNNHEIERNQQEREQARKSLAQKIETMETRVRENITQVKDTVRRSTDLHYQVDQRPWTMMAVAVAAGCVVGRAAFGRRQTFSDQVAKSLANIVRQAGDETQASYAALRENFNDDQYSKQIGMIKVASISALTSIAGELARHLVPTILAQIDKYYQNKRVPPALR